MIYPGLWVVIIRLLGRGCVRRFSGVAGFNVDVKANCLYSETARARWLSVAECVVGCDQLTYRRIGRYRRSEPVADPEDRAVVRLVIAAGVFFGE